MHSLFCCCCFLSGDQLTQPLPFSSHWLCELRKLRTGVSELVSLILLHYAFKLTKQLPSTLKAIISTLIFQLWFSSRLQANQEKKKYTKQKALPQWWRQRPRGTLWQTCRSSAGSRRESHSASGWTRSSCQSHPAPPSSGPAGPSGLLGTRHWKTRGFNSHNHSHHNSDNHCWNGCKQPCAHKIRTTHRQQAQRQVCTGGLEVVFKQMSFEGHTERGSRIGLAQSVKHQPSFYVY